MTHVLASRALNMSGYFDQSAHSIESRCVVKFFQKYWITMDDYLIFLAQWCVQDHVTVDQVKKKLTVIKEFSLKKIYLKILSILLVPRVKLSKATTNITFGEFTPMVIMMTSTGNIFHVTGILWGESTSHLWIPLTKTSDMELLWSAPDQTIEKLVIWDAIRLIMTSL